MIKFANQLICNYDNADDHNDDDIYKDSYKYNEAHHLSNIISFF